MNLSSFFILVGIVLVAVGISYYHYLYKAKSKSKTILFLAFLRFCSVFTLLLLLWNPLVTATKYEEYKTPLPIIFDNSSSISELKAGEQAQDLYNQLQASKELSSKYAIQYLGVEAECAPLSGLNFTGKQSRLDQAGKQLTLLYRNQSYPSIFITDGNQTAGNDFVYSFDPINPIYPVVLGDTISYFDIKIDQVQANKYAFYQNKFPVEVQLSYNGTQSCSTQLKLMQANKIIHTETVTLQPNQAAQLVSFLVPANALGAQLYQVVVQSAKPEKNSVNNSKKIIVDVLDQRRTIAIVSTSNHPDIAALKRAIEHNGQSKVELVKPADVKSIADYAVVVLYQPTTRFTALFADIKRSKTPYMVVTGMQTDFAFLNQQQSDLTCKMSTQAEEFLPKYTDQFTLFAADDLGFDQFPPLQNPFGTTSVAASTMVLLGAKIQGVDTQQPLLCFGGGVVRSAYLLGENSWKWRMQYHVKNQSYDKYDVFVDKIIQYLASTGSRKSLVVSHERFYNAGEELGITAQYFTKNFEFDENAKLQLQCNNTKTKTTQTLEMLKQASYFKANLEGLAAGNYSFSIKETRSNTTYNGSFEVLDFQIEKQFVNPNRNQLLQLAVQTKGQLYYPAQLNQLIDKLLKDPNYQKIQKEITQKTPVLDWVYLLIFLVFTFALEWFVRKYNGLL
ncbi:MAG: hypothetical protein NTX74_10040 [Flavobacterium sp.]|nr:hypothetical protein [Flavobacterium sp.]